MDQPSFGCWISFSCGLLRGKSKVTRDLIDRELFFGNPALASPQLSPTGSGSLF